MDMDWGAISGGLEIFMRIFLGFLFLVGLGITVYLSSLWFRLFAGTTDNTRRANLAGWFFVTGFLLFATLLFGYGTVGSLLAQFGVDFWDTTIGTIPASWVVAFVLAGWVLLSVGVWRKG